MPRYGSPNYNDPNQTPILNCADAELVPDYRLMMTVQSRNEIVGEF